jgi:hypothetical protein
MPILVVLSLLALAVTQVAPLHANVILSRYIRAIGG